MRSSLPSVSVSFLFFCLTAALLSCSQAGRLPATPVPNVPAANASPQVSPTNTAVHASDSSVEDQILVSVSKALRRAKLLSRPDQCYAYRFDPAAGQPAYTVDVRENHSHPECGGDPQTQPHLFTVHVDKTSRALSQDATTPGSFQPVAP